MNELPEFWRTEVFHPLSVHFPIALLFVAFLFKSIAIWSKRETWQLGGSILLFLGVVGLWVAIYTGNLADGIVSRKICDPTILKEHQNLSYTTSWVFTFTLALDVLRPIFKKFIENKERFLNIFIAIIMLIGVGFLSYTGHLGAGLVYQQGAGVYSPSPDCNEFN